MLLHRILVATDFSEASVRALETALALELAPDATVYLLHVLATPLGIDPILGFARSDDTERYDEVMDRLTALAPSRREDSATVEPCLAAGLPATEIARMAAEKDVDMIVIGTHGRKGLAHLLLGSTAESLLREAPCQVLVVKPHVSGTRARS